LYLTFAALASDLCLLISAIWSSTDIGSCVVAGVREASTADTSGSESSRSSSLWFAARFSSSFASADFLARLAAWRLAFFLAALDCVSGDPDEHAHVIKKAKTRP
jgi:hypothetical protein